MDAARPNVAPAAELDAKPPGASKLGLFGVDPADEILATDRFEQGWVVGAQMLADQLNHRLLAVTARHISAFAPDQTGHDVLLDRPSSRRYCDHVGVALVSPVLRINVCGPLVVHRGGQRIDVELPGRQGRLLFAYLVLNRHRPVPRDELAEALWREPDPAAVDARLNPLLSKLRRVLGADSVQARTTIRLHLEAAWVDVEAAHEAIHRAESAAVQHQWTRAWAPALTALFISERELLPGEAAPRIDDYRHQLALVRLRALDCYAGASLRIGGTEVAAAERAAHQLVTLAPLRESGYRHLMEALAAQGNIAEALAVYQDLSEHLRDQLGASPSPATRDLHQRLLTLT